MGLQKCTTMLSIIQEGSKIDVYFTIYEYSIEFLISDDGIGIFEKIKSAFGLEHHHEVFAALAKGGLTTDPEHHSGQGIFFTSRAFENFWIISKGGAFSHNSDEEDWLLENNRDFKGTLLQMSISKTSGLALKKLFDDFTEDKDELTVFNTHGLFACRHWPTKISFLDLKRSESWPVSTNTRRFFLILRPSTSLAKHSRMRYSEFFQL